MYWQKKGDFLAVKVERYTKSKKVIIIFNHVDVYKYCCFSPWFSTYGLYNNSHHNVQYPCDQFVIFNYKICIW